MKVSVIVPVYNVEKYLHQCVDSVLGQTYQDLEVILVDDGSTDGCPAICDEYAKKDPRVQVIHQKNGGLSAARNAGYRIASGTYVMYLDSDDWIDLDTCATVIDLAMKYNAQLVFWPYVRDYANMEVPKTLFHEDMILFDKKTFRQLVYKTMIGLHDDFLCHPEHADTLVTVWGKLYQKEMLDCCGAEFENTKDIGTEDALYNINTLKTVSSAVYVKKYMNHYRKTNLNSLTRTYKPQLHLQWKELFKRMRNSIQMDEQSDDLMLALNNRIGLSIIGLGLNAITLPGRKALDEIKKILSDPDYCKAIMTLPMKYFPVYWWVFFFFCKIRFSVGVFLLLKCMERIRG